MAAVDVGGLLLGSDRQLCRRHLLAAGGLVVAGLGLQYWRWRATPRGVGWGLPGVDFGWLVVAGAVGLAAVSAYRDDGLLAGWALGSALPLAAVLRPVVVPTMAFDEPILVALGMGLIVGFGAGTIGFGLGTIGRRAGVR